jgi:D-threo-aldose 1-dehydrogenase
MIANSMTIHSHPGELVEFMRVLEKQKIVILNSAAFNAAFLTGLAYDNYQLKDLLKDKSFYHWREMFYQLCLDYKIKPVEACVVFGPHTPGVKSIV